MWTFRVSFAFLRCPADFGLCLLIAGLLNALFCVDGGIIMSLVTNLEGIAKLCTLSLIDAMQRNRVESTDIYNFKEMI